MDQDRIAQIIKEIRQQNNLTQKELADELGVTFQAVSKWETGKNIPDIAILREISNKYKIDINTLLDTSHQSVKKNNKKPVLYFILALVLLGSIVGTVIAIKNRNDDFNFKKLGTAEKNFNLTGTVVYNDNKTIITIDTIEYAGEDTETYDEIDCSLFEDKGNTRVKIASKQQVFTTIQDFLQKVTFEIDDYKIDCNKEPSLLITISAKKDSKIVAYQIPLELNDICLD